MAFFDVLKLPSRCLLIAGLSSSLALLGCSTPATPTRSANPEALWSGRLGLQIHESSDQAQSFSASFQLQGAPQQGSLAIFNPFGSQVAHLQWQPGQAFLQQGSQQIRSASLEELLIHSTGTALPVAVMFDWLQGQPTALDGWNVDLSRYSEGRITAHRTQPAPEATLRLILQNGTP